MSPSDPEHNDERHEQRHGSGSDENERSPEEERPDRRDDERERPDRPDQDRPGPGGQTPGPAPGAPPPASSQGGHRPPPPRPPTPSTTPPPPSSPGPEGPRPPAPGPPAPPPDRDEPTIPPPRPDTPPREPDRPQPPSSEEPPEPPHEDPPSASVGAGSTDAGGPEEPPSSEEPPEPPHQDPPSTEAPTAEEPEDAESEAQEPVAALPSRQRVLDGLTKASKIVLVVAVFLTPVVFDPRTLDAFNLTKLTTLWVLTVVAFGLWAATAVERRFSFPRSSVLRMAFILIGVATLSTALSSNRVLSIFGLYHRYGGLLSLLLYLVLLFLVIVLFRERPEGLRLLAIGVGAGAVAVSIYVVLQRLGLDPMAWQQASGRPVRTPIGNLGNSGFTGMYLGMGIPVVVYLAVCARVIIERLAWATAGVLVVVALTFTQGRAGMLAAALGIGAFVLFSRHWIKPWKKVAGVFGLLFVLAILPVVSFGLFGAGGQAWGLFGSRSTQFRVHWWDAAWHMMLDRPFLGWGPDTFYQNYPRFRTPADARQLGLEIADKPHNILLEWGATTGVIGLLAFLALVGTALWFVSKHGPDLPLARRRLAACFGGVLVAYLVEGLFWIDVPPIAMMLWITLGAIAVVADPGTRRDPEFGPPEEEAPEEAPGEEEEPAAPAPVAGGSPEADLEPPRGTRSVRRWGAHAVIAALVLVLVGLGFRPLRADHAAWAAQRRAGAGWSAETLRLHQRAMELNPFEAAYRGLTASYFENVAGNQGTPLSVRQALTRAARRYEAAHELQPGNVYFMINAARVYQRLGRRVDVAFFEQANDWWEMAAEQDPLDPQVHQLYAQLLQRWANNTDDEDRKQEIQRLANAQAQTAQRLRQG